MSFQAGNYPDPLQEALAPITGVSTPFHQGMTSFVTFAETALGPVAIKHAVDVRLAALRREKNILDALDAPALPVPECLLYHEAETAQGPEGWLVMRRLPGQPLLQLLRTDDRATLTHALKNLGKTLAQLHAAPIPQRLNTRPYRWLEEMLELA
jgi:aminoglycoside phosphotransferase